MPEITNAWHGAGVLVLTAGFSLAPLGFIGVIPPSIVLGVVLLGSALIVAGPIVGILVEVWRAVSKFS